MKKDNVVRFRANDSTVKRIDEFVELSKTNRSIVLRELLPDPEVIRAFYLRDTSLSELNTGRGLMHGFVMAAVNTLVQEMTKPGDGCIELQIEVSNSIQFENYNPGTDSPDPCQLIASLYIKWKNAKADHPDYGFLRVLGSNDVVQYFVYGPDDNKAENAAIVAYMKELDRQLKN